MTQKNKTVAGQVAFITGAGQGIGRAIAERLHADGFKVAIADFNDETAAEVAASLGGKEGGAIAIHVDVANRESMMAAVEATIEEFGDLHVVLNNAGIVPITGVEQVTQEDFDRTYSINVGGVLWGIQAAVQAFELLGHGGKILSASSQAGHVGNPGISIYSASKFAVRGLTQSAAQELAHRGITVNAWSPGTVKTPMLDSVVHAEAKAAGETYEEALAKREKSITIGRLSTPGDVANVVSFLAGPDSNYITGQSIVVDGGMVFS